MTRLPYFVWLMLVCGAIFALYQIKYRVQAVQGDIASVEQELAKEQEAMHVLNAEWHYLNRPDRLAMLLEGQAKETLEPISANQLAAIDNIPFAPVTDPSSPSADFGTIMPSSWNADHQRKP